MKMADLRREYTLRGLVEGDLDPDPVRQFKHWFETAQSGGSQEINACALATAAAGGQPSVRMVLLKDVSERGFAFFTNYESRKGRELRENPRAALLFWWPELERQVRIDGTVERVTAAESDAYFARRPRGSQLAASVSSQSRSVVSRTDLEAQFAALDAKLAGQAVTRPENWGGFRLLPLEFEFWQGRMNRLHDRLVYRRGTESGWTIVRLAP